MSGVAAAHGAGSEESAELAVLTRVFNRLTTASDQRLQSVVPKLLPGLLPNLNTTHASVRNKAVEVLSHISKRVRPNKSIQLPCQALVSRHGSFALTLNPYSCKPQP